MGKVIYIIGAGAIGRALAVCLSNDGQDVLLVRSREVVSVPVMETIGLELPDGGTLSANLNIINFSDLHPGGAVYIVTTKSFVNDQVAEKLQQLDPSAPVVLLQNGLNIERAFLLKGFTNLYRCVVMVTSQVNIDGTIRFRPVAACPVGAVHAQLPVTAVLKQLENLTFPFVQQNDIQTYVWKKAIINCVFNSVCPLLEIDNGVFYREAYAQEIADRMIRECLMVANRLGVSLDPSDVKETLLSISWRSDGQLISTLQDIRRRQPTEMETLNLEVAAIAATLGLEQEVRQTQLLGELTYLKSLLNR